jgi:hypothetical protein
VTFDINSFSAGAADHHSDREPIRGEGIVREKECRGNPNPLDATPLSVGNRLLVSRGERRGRLERAR